MEIPEQTEKTEPKRRIQGYFSQEFYLGRQKLAEFLRQLADEVEKEGEIKISTAEWELPFNARDQVEVEIELDDDELEIEIDFEKARTGKNLTVG